MATIQRVVPFSPRDVAHFNALRNALVNVLGIAADNQAYVQVAQVLFGSGLASIGKDGSNNLILQDPIAGTKVLSALGGAAVPAIPLFIGEPFDSVAHFGFEAANDVYLTPETIDTLVTITDMQINVYTSSSENIQLGVYDVAGNLLRKTAVVTNNVSGLRKIPLSTSLSLAQGRIYLAFTGSGTTGQFLSDGRQYIIRRVTRGSWAELPATISIPSGADDSAYYGGMGVQGVVTGGIY
jgi:hypothetical protein